MDRKQFMRDVYPDYWLAARERKYGFMDYDRRLCELVVEGVDPPAEMLEVAIGTGYPVADFLVRCGYGVHGIDIAPSLIDRCRELNPDIDARLGDAEHLEFADDSFDRVYCFHSTWYFPDLPRVIDEMLRVTRAGGRVLFDVQNAANPEIALAHARRVAQVRPGLLPRLALQARNVAKVVLGRGNPNWHGVVYEVPTDPRDVFEHLRRSKASEFGVFARDESGGSLFPLPGIGPFPDFPRLVFAACK